MYEELIKELREHAAKQCPMEEAYGMCGCINARKAADAIEEMQDTVQAQDKALKQCADQLARRWIPMTERLPEEIGNYLVVINCPRGRWDEICAFDGEKEWVSIDEYAEIATKWVTHWMPLPEPPKEECE